MLDQIIYISVILLTVSIPLVYWWRYQHRSARAVSRLQDAKERGLTEPVSLHPSVEANRCIATGACIGACPEGGILGIVDGKAELVSPSKCIGHGACLSACPVSAISLVFGTERRGVEIPEIKENFETNVKGIYIAGELGGMGLIRNAVTQGREAAEYIASDKSARREGIHDVIIVGAGPAGLAATLQAKKEGLDYLTLEQEKKIGGAVLSYPRQKLVMTQPMIIPIFGAFKRRDVRKEELVELWNEVMAKSGISVRCGEKVEEIQRTEDCFVVHSSSGDYRSSRVLLAIGRRGTPRRLGVEGESSSKVAYKLVEPEQYANARVLVVGGGDSAVEAALALADQPGTTVTLSYRKAVFSRIKDANRDRFDTAVAAARISAFLESEVTGILPDEITLRRGDTVTSLPNDYVLIFAGGEMPTAFLKKAGVDMHTKFGTR